MITLAGGTVKTHAKGMLGILCLTWVAAAPLDGQVLSGMVAEQGTLEPAPGAVISILRVSGDELLPTATTVSDLDGVFTISLDGPGLYRVQADLDGLSSPLSAEIQLSEGETRQDLALLVPSRLLMMAYSCPATGAEPGAAVVGMVRAAADDMVVPYGRVRARWTLDGRTTEMIADADQGARFRLCDVPPAGTVEFRAELAGQAGPWSSVEIARPAVVLHDVALALDDRSEQLSGITDIQARILEEAAAKGLGDLRGVVVDQSSGAPVGDVVVNIEGTGYQGITDPQGLFLFPDLTPGDYVLRLQHLGYSVATGNVTVPGGQEVSLRLNLAPRAIEVAGIEVNVRSAVEELARLTPFRRDLVYGEEMADAEIRGANAVDILRTSTPGLRVVEIYPAAGPPQICISTNRRVGSLQGGTGCDPIQIVIDGVRSPEGAESLRRYPASEIESIEFLPPSQAQVLYGVGGNTGNGVVVIWTRGKGPFASPLRQPRGRT